MDVDATLAQPIAAVFAHLAAPAHLGDWLADVQGVQVEVATTWPLDGSAVFGLRLRVDGGALAASGELIAYEPPWLVAYRLCVGERTHIVRLACTASAAGTRLRIHQGGATESLALDLERLRRALRARGAAAAPERARAAAEAPEGAEDGGAGPGMGQAPGPRAAP
jgi:uncharacterized protein YndB with AHSA1/START domain